MLLIDPGVVHQHIDSAEAVDDAPDERLRLLGFGDVSRQCQMATARECGEGVVGRSLIGAELDHERRAKGRELLGHGSIDPAGAARDQHDHAVEAHLHSMPGLVRRCAVSRPQLCCHLR
jgi:hypothetical protein